MESSRRRIVFARLYGGAFSFGLKHDLNPLRDGDAVLFGLKHNPAAHLPTIEGAERANTEALSKEELREVLKAVNALSGRRRSLAAAMIYLAGQRVEMLVRSTWADVSEDDEHGLILRLVDYKAGKGRRHEIISCRSQDE